LIEVAERRDRRRDPVEHFVVLVLAVEGDQRNRKVEDLVALHAKRLAAQAMVATERLHPRACGLDQVFHHRRRDVVAVQRGFERALIAACARLEPVSLADAVVERGVGVDRVVVGFVERAEGFFAVGLLAACRKDRPVLSVRHGHFFTVRERHLRELGVGGRQ
jgi:hypothetical protein